MPTLDADTMVLNTVYIEPDADEHLHYQAKLSGESKAELFRRYLAVGVKATRAQPGSLTAGSRPLMLRTVHLDAKLDAKLRAEAFDARVPRNDLIRRYVQLGMVLHAATAAAASRP